MKFIGTCYTFSARHVDSLMKGAYKVSYSRLVARVKREYPDLYEEMALNLRNDFEDECCQTRTHYILVWSGINYFFLKDKFYGKDIQ